MSSEAVRSAQAAFARGNADKARKLLEAGVENGDPEAAYSLAVSLAYGQGGPVDFERAASLLEPLSDPLPQAASFYRFALAHGWHANLGWADAVSHLVSAAQAGNAAAKRECGLLCLLANMRNDASALLVEAAISGDEAAGMALFRLGLANTNDEWAQRTSDGLQRSRHPLADVLTTGSRANSPATSSTRLDWPKFEQRLIEWEPQLPEADSVIPDIQANSFLSVLPAAICDYVLTTGLRQLRPSTIVDEATGQKIQDPHRQSLSMTFAPHRQDMVHIAVEQTMAAMAGLPPETTERMNLLFYRPGEHYKPHVDYFAGDETRNTAELERAGQRVATSLICLHPAERGGATRFPRYETGWSGETGDGFTFRNVKGDGTVDPLTLHQGEPVTSGWKALASLWIRERAA